MGVSVYLSHNVPQRQSKLRLSRVSFVKYLLHPESNFGQLHARGVRSRVVPVLCFLLAMVNFVRRRQDLLEVTVHLHSKASYLCQIIQVDSQLRMCVLCYRIRQPVEFGLTKLHRLTAVVACQRRYPLVVPFSTQMRGKHLGL